MEERVEEQIRMMKKERNRTRAGIQRKAPNPKRQKLDEDGERSKVDHQERKQWIIPEIEKRKWGEQEERERCRNEPKRLKKDDIRFFMNLGGSDCSTEGQAEHDQDRVVLSNQPEETCSGKLHERAEQQCSGDGPSDQGDQDCSEEMQPGREGYADQAEQDEEQCRGEGPSREDSQEKHQYSAGGDQAEQYCSEEMQQGREGAADQAEHVSSWENERDEQRCSGEMPSEHLVWDQAELQCSAERGEMGQAEPGCRSNMSDGDDDQRDGRNRC